MTHSIAKGRAMSGLTELLARKDIEVLQSAASARRDTFLPWRGSFGRAKRLAKAGLLREAGSSVMPPYILYVITDEGRALISRTPATGGKP